MRLDEMGPGAHKNYGLLMGWGHLKWNGIRLDWISWYEIGWDGMS